MDKSEDDIPAKKSKLDDYFKVIKTSTTSTLTQKSADSQKLDFLIGLSELASSRDQIPFEDIRKTGMYLSYCEAFLPKTLADALLVYCEKNIKYQENSKVRVFGKWHTVQRKQIAYGDEGLTYEFSGSNLLAERWPNELDELRKYVSKVVGVDFNFVLVNRYADGNDNIGEHRDRESEIDPTACIASLSIGQCRDFVFRHESRVRKGDFGQQTPPDNVVFQLKHGSLLLMHPPTNTHWYHSLPKRKRLVGVRVNFTFRKMIRK